jgi:DNA-binding GntR family transcriptional regulator
MSTLMKTATIKSRVYDSITNDILNGVYPQDYVFNEKSLVEKYNVSKSPVRDALLELCNEGVLRSIPRFGYIIVNIAEKQLREILELRVLLECDNLRQLFDRITDEKINDLRKILIVDLKNTRNRNDTVIEHWHNNVYFHRQLYSLSNNDYGRFILDKCLNASIRAYAQYFRNELRYSTTNLVQNHEELLDHLQNRDLEKAITTLQKDIRSFKI